MLRLRNSVKRTDWIEWTQPDLMHREKIEAEKAILLACSRSVWFIVIQGAKRNPSFTRPDVLWFFIPRPSAGCVMFSVLTRGFFISCREWWGSFGGVPRQIAVICIEPFFLVPGVQIAYLAIIGTQLFMILLSIVLLVGIHKVSKFRVCNRACLI